MFQVAQRTASLSSPYGQLGGAFASPGHRELAGIANPTITMQEVIKCSPTAIYFCARKNPTISTFGGAAIPAPGLGPVNSARE